MTRPRRPDRPLAEQYEQWMTHLRRLPVSRRPAGRGPVGAAVGNMLLGSGATRTTMVLRYISEQGRELDRVVFSRTAGGGIPPVTDAAPGKSM